MRVLVLILWVVGFNSIIPLFAASIPPAPVTSEWSCTVSVHLFRNLGGHVQTNSPITATCYVTLEEEVESFQPSIGFVFIFYPVDSVDSNPLNVSVINQTGVSPTFFPVTCVSGDSDCNITGPSYQCISHGNMCDPGVMFQYNLTAADLNSTGVLWQTPPVSQLPQWIMPNHYYIVYNVQGDSTAALVEYLISVIITEPEGNSTDGNDTITTTGDTNSTGHDMSPDVKTILAVVLPIGIVTVVAIVMCLVYITLDRMKGAAQPMKLFGNEGEED